MHNPDTEQSMGGSGSGAAPQQVDSQVGPMRHASLKKPKRDHSGNDWATNAAAGGGEGSSSHPYSAFHEQGYQGNANGNGASSSSSAWLNSGMDDSFTTSPGAASASNGAGGDGANATPSNSTGNNGTTSKLQANPPVKAACTFCRSR